VGSEAGVQIRDQSNGSMADETIVRVHGRNLLSGSANVKWPMESGNNGDFAGKQKPWRGQGSLRMEDGKSRIKNESNGTGDRASRFERHGSLVNIEHS
jgi:hypothetical protein